MGDYSIFCKKRPGAHSKFRVKRRDWRRLLEGGSLIEGARIKKLLIQL